MHRVKAKPAKIIFFATTLVIAVLIASITIGRELFAEKTESIFSFALIHFSGYLFFLLMPVELVFIYYLPFYPGVKLVAVALGTAIVAQCFDYFIGKLISPQKILNLMGERRIEKSKGYIQKFGLLTIFIFNLFPLSSPVVALVAGMIRFDFRKFITVSSLGLLLKYAVIALCF